MIFFLRSLHKTDLALNILPFIASVCYTPGPFRFTFAPFLTVKIIAFFCLPFLICLFIPIYFWYSLTIAERVSETFWLIALCFCANLPLHNTQFTDTLPLENQCYLKEFSVAARVDISTHILNHYKVLLEKLCRLPQLTVLKNSLTF